MQPGPSARLVADQVLAATICQVHLESRGTCGAPRIHAELRLGMGMNVGRKGVSRLMRLADLQGVCHRRKRRGWKPAPAPHEDLVNRIFRAEAPDRLWFSDITQHRAKDGWAHCPAVIDA
ncbi:IS3 family transposase [Demequina sp. TTPB684]|nr:IS3 family transposase [Demequina sp. TTPB684]